MPRRRKPEDKLRVKLNLTIHPDVRAWADEITLKRRRSISQLFEDLVEAAYLQMKNPEAPQQPIAPQQPAAPQGYYYPPQPYYYPAPQAPQQPQQ